MVQYINQRFEQEESCIIYKVHLEIDHNLVNHGLLSLCIKIVS